MEGQPAESTQVQRLTSAFYLDAVAGYDKQLQMMLDIMQGKNALVSALEPKEQIDTQVKILKEFPNVTASRERLVAQALGEPEEPAGQAAQAAAPTAAQRRAQSSANA